MENPFSDDLVFCEKHSSTSDVIDVIECPNCKLASGRNLGELIAAACENATVQL